jgi:hypothetical protein
MASTREVVWKQHYSLGEQIAAELEAYESFSHIGRVVGLSKQGARMETMKALGKFVQRMREINGVMQ